MGWNTISVAFLLQIVSFLCVTGQHAIHGPAPHQALVAQNSNYKDWKTSTEKSPIISDELKMNQPAGLDGRNTDLSERGAIILHKGKWTAFRLAMKNGLKDAWNFGQQVKVLVHGYNWVDVDDLESRLGKLLDLAKEYQSINKNIIIYDWYAYATESHGNTEWDYYNAYLSIAKVGRNLRQFLVDLQSSSRYKPLSVNKDDIHIIGFDLGAHVGAYGALEGKVANRITGIEPAGPNLRQCNFMASGRLGEYDSVNRLKTSLGDFDAPFVDVFHCNVGCQHRQAGKPEDEQHDSLDDGTLGSNANHGHIDIYVNDGVTQPECTNVTNYPSKKDKGLCSHNQCIDFFKKTIKDGNMKACRATFDVKAQKVEPKCNLGSIYIGDRGSKPSDGGLYHIAS